MRKLRGWAVRLRGLFGKLRKNQELDDEIESHLEMHTEDNLRLGMPPEEAHRQALIKLGGVESTKEAYRDQRGLPFLETLSQDIRYGLRGLRKNPGFTAVALISLALAIGAGTAVFSHVNAILLRSLPLPNPQELRVVQWAGDDVQMTSFEGVSTQEGNRWTTADCVPHPIFRSLREQCAGKADLFGFCPIREAIATVHGETFVVTGTMVSENFFSGLDVRPGLGRLLQEGEDFAGAMNVVLSYRMWEKYFRLDPAAVGQTFTLDKTSYTIVGILPRAFPGLRPSDPSEFYVPMSAASPFLYRPINENFHWFVRLMARLHPGTGDGDLKALLDVAFARVAGGIMKNPGMLVEAGRSGPGYDRSNYGKLLWLMLAVTGLVILAACANLAGLLLARGAARQHELALRASLGASRWRLVRQSLTENLVLAILGGGLGVLLAIWGRTAIARLLAGSADGLRASATLDLTVLGFGLAMALATAFCSGLLPALRAARVDPADGLKSRGTLGVPRLRTGKILVTAQISLSLLLLTGAALYTRTLVNLTHIDAGFGVEKLHLAELTIRAGDYAEAHPAEFYQRAQDSVASLPGVRSATLMGFPLLADEGWTGGFSFPGKPTEPGGETCRLSVGSTFFTTLGIPILEGRGFESADSGTAPKVVVVNECFVRKYLPGQHPVGMTISVLGADWRIVGVSRDAKYDNIKKPVQPTTYFPVPQMFLSPSLSKNLGSVALAVRTALPPLALSTALRQSVAAIDRGVAITKISTQGDLRDQSINQERLLAKMCTFLAFLAVLLSCIGLYGLMAYNVARRSSEIAIRMAIGAQRRAVAGSIMREASGLAAIGIGAGLPVAFAATRLIKSQLFGVPPNDPATYAAVIAILMAVAVFAAWLPARRAARVDPMAALRCE